MMNAVNLRSISPEDRKRWEDHNIQTLREWRAIPFTEKIRMLEEMEDLARSMHGGKLPSKPSESENGTTVEKP
jgi:hypothetical protein